MQASPHVLRGYAFLADGHRGALIGPRGDIGWLCVPHWDSDAVFADLLGGRGRYAVTAADPRFVWGGFYQTGTLMWTSRWVTTRGIVHCRESLAFPGDPRRVVLLRRIEAVEGDATVNVTLDPRAGFGRRPLRELSHQDGIWRGRTGGLWLRWTGAGRARPGPDGALAMSLRVPHGGHHDLVLEIADHNPEQGAPVDPDEAWRATERAWLSFDQPPAGCVAQRDARGAMAVLRGMTVPGGGMVAAATTSLPERFEAGRNYDYRYAWIRDQCFAGQAAAAAGAEPLLDAAVDFVSARLLADGPDLAPAYTAHAAAPVPQQRPLDFLPGYPGAPARTGNWVRGQFQLDTFGEALLLLAAAAHRDRLDFHAARAMHTAATAIAERWTEPDAGVWELEPRQWTHSKLTCVAGLRAAARVVPGPQAAEWAALADTILAHVARHATDPTGRWHAPTTTPGWTRRYCCPPSAVRCPPTTRAPRPLSPPYAASCNATGTSTGSGPTSDHSGRRRARSCSVGWPPPSLPTRPANRSRQPATSSATAPPADPPGSTRRSTTSTSVSYAATYLRHSSTP